MVARRHSVPVNSNKMSVVSFHISRFAGCSRDGNARFQALVTHINNILSLVCAKYLAKHAKRDETLCFACSNIPTKIMVASTRSCPVLYGRAGK